MATEKLILETNANEFASDTDKMSEAIDRLNSHLDDVSKKSKQAGSEAGKSAGIWAGVTAGAMGIAAKAAEKLAERFMKVAEANDETSKKMADVGKLVDKLLAIALPAFNAVLDHSIVLLQGMVTGLNAWGISAKEVTKTNQKLETSFSDLEKANKEIMAAEEKAAEEEKKRAEERKRQAEERWKQIQATAKAYLEVQAATLRANEFEAKHNTIVSQATSLTKDLLTARRDSTATLVDGVIPSLVTTSDMLGDINDLEIQYVTHTSEFTAAMNKMAEVSRTSFGVVQGLMEQTGKTIMGLFSFGKGDATAGITSILGQFAGGLTQLSAKFGDNLAGNLTGALGGVLGFASQLIGLLFSKEFQALAGKIPQIISASLKNLPGMADTALQIIDEILAAVPDIFDALIAVLPNFITTALNKIVDALPVLVPAMIDLGVAIAVGIIESLPDIIQGIIKALPDIIAALADGIYEITKTWVSALIPDWLEEWVSSQLEAQGQDSSTARVTTGRGTTGGIYYGDTPGVMRSSGAPMTLQKGDYFVASQSLAGLETMTGASNKQRDYQIKLQMATLEKMTSIDAKLSSSSVRPANIDLYELARRR